MSASSHTEGRGTFDPTQAADSMWKAFEQMRSSFDKRVGVRMGRGDVRASVLALLAEESMHGYQIIREIESRTDGRWKPSAGSVYPTLQMLADEGLVTTEMSGDRKVYSLTDEGRREAATAAASTPWATDDDGDTNAFSAVPKAGIDLAQAMAQVVRTGSKAQQEHAVEVLNEARRKIYSILAQD